MTTHPDLDIVVRITQNPEDGTFTVHTGDYELGPLKTVLAARTYVETKLKKLLDRWDAGIVPEQTIEQPSEHQVCQQNIQELWAALAMIRKTVETLGPPGAVANGEYLSPEPMREAEAIVKGIQAIADLIPTRPAPTPRNPH